MMDGITGQYARQRPWRSSWSHRLRIFGIYLYISNVRMKKRSRRDLEYTGVCETISVKNRQTLYKRQGGVCPYCGKPFGYQRLELHHILPVSRFPGLKTSIRNVVLLCHDCHREVHIDPWKNIRMMEEKAEELGIDLTEYYKDYRTKTKNNEKTTKEMD